MDALSGPRSKNEAYNLIVDSTCGIIFLGTPFEGSEAGYAKIAPHYFELVNSTLSEMPTDLEERSKVLANIANTFLKFLRSRDRDSTQVEITCFFEQLSTEIATKNEIIVPKASATIPGYESLSIPANHSEMCKFKSIDEVGYRQISARLDRWIRAISSTESSSIYNSSYNNAIIGNMYSGNSGVFNVNGHSTMSFNNLWENRR